MATALIRPGGPIPNLLSYNNLFENQKESFYSFFENNSKNIKKNASFKVKFTFPDGKTAVKDIPVGKLVWSDSVTHQVEVLATHIFLLVPLLG